MLAKKESKEQVFPTGVGVNRESLCPMGSNSRIPHRRGGEPLDSGEWGGDDEYSPQAWG